MSTSTKFVSKNSRNGKKAIALPKGVTATLKDSVITVKGKKGTLEQAILPEVIVQIEDDKITVVQNSSSNVYGRKTRAVQGLTRSLINNMVTGVSAGFTKELEIIGVGYKADVKGWIDKTGKGKSGSSKSYTNEPWKIDWKLKMPLKTLYFDRIKISDKMPDYLK